MDTRQLRYFEAIFERRSLTTAAGELRIAVSALSHHLANLETELGQKLFHRRPRGLEPTAAGERLYAHAKAILRAMQAAERDIKASGGEVAGDVTIGMAYSAVKAIGVPLLRRILTGYPKLNLSLSESLSGTTLAHLLAADVDMALVYNPPTDPRLKSVPVLEESMVLIGQESIIGGTGQPIAFHDTLGLPMIILRQGISARALVEDATLLKKLESSARFQLNSVHAIGGALIEGIGCAIGTRLFLQEHIETGALAVRPIIMPELSRTLHLCQMADRPSSYALEAVQRLVIELVHQAIDSGLWQARKVEQA